VLVHGAWGDSANWDGVVSRLQHDGYTVYVPPNPLLGLTYDAASIRDFLDTIPGPIILVGHSYGGAVITNAATGDPNVKALVYDDAFIPAQGQTIGQLVSAVPGSCAGGPNLVLVPYPGAPAGAFGYFQVTNDVRARTRAAVFQPGIRTGVLVRFSTVAGERGSPGTWRDPRGFAVKFYTSQGSADAIAVSSQPPANPRLRSARPQSYAFALFRSVAAISLYQTRMWPHCQGENPHPPVS
jgi:pimeloyl-ACP methyl ester carboxylesterase